jgi:hypothetical protein
MGSVQHAGDAPRFSEGVQARGADCPSLLTEITAPKTFA